MLHQDILTISFKHRYEIQRVLKDVLGLHGIQHLSLDLVRPDGEMIFLSSTPLHGYEVCSKGYGAYDATITPEYYTNRSFYWWHDAKHKGFSKEIYYLKQVRFGFHYGFMLVRKWDDFYIIYSYATDQNDKAYVDKVQEALDELLEIGDYAYNNLRDIYMEYTGQYIPPLIDTFYPYVEGKPVQRYSKQNGILVPSHKGRIQVGSRLKLVSDSSHIHLGESNDVSVRGTPTPKRHLDPAVKPRDDNSKVGDDNINVTSFPAKAGNPGVLGAPTPKERLDTTVKPRDDNSKVGDDNINVTSFPAKAGNPEVLGTPTPKRHFDPAVKSRDDNNTLSQKDKQNITLVVDNE